MPIFGQALKLVDPRATEAEFSFIRTNYVHIQFLRTNYTWNVEIEGTTLQVSSQSLRLLLAQELPFLCRTLTAQSWKPIPLSSKCRGVPANWAQIHWYLVPNKRMERKLITVKFSMILFFLFGVAIDKDIDIGRHMQPHPLISGPWKL